MKEKALVAKVHEYLGHLQSVYALAIGTEPHRFYSAGSDGIVAEWDAHQRENVRGLMKAPSAIYSLGHMQDCGILVAGQNDGGLHVIDLAQSQLRKSTRVHQRPIFCIKQLANKAGHFIVCSEDGHFSIWDCETLSCQLRAQVSRQSLRTIAFHPSRPEFAIAGSDGHIRVYHLDDLKLMHKWQAHSNSVFSLVYDPNGQLLLSGSRDAHLKSWDARNGYSPVQSVPAHLFAINDIAFAPDGLHIATASMDKTIKLWDPYTLTLIKVIDRPRNQCHHTGVNRLLWLPTGELLSCSDDKLIMQWDVRFEDVSTS